VMQFRKSHWCDFVVKSGVAAFNSPSTGLACQA
jgi:hypothetical protein